VTNGTAPPPWVPVNIDSMTPSLFPRTPPDPRPSADTGTVRLRLACTTVVDLEAARRLLDAPDWLGSAVGPEQPGMRRFVTDLELPLRAGQPQTVFRKAAFVDLGEPQAIDGGLRAAIGWRSSTLAPLFPVFAGRLDVRPSGLVLDGCYAPPGGEAGRILDRAFLGVAARGTARWFLDRVCAEMAAARGRSVSAPGPASTTEGPQPR
jgi:hypothetical protein